MKKWATGLLIVVWMAVIFAFSNQIAEESAQSSQTVAYQIASWQNEVFQLQKGEEELVAQADSMQFSIRKCAHMSEYAVLAVLFFLHLSCYPLARKWTVLLSWVFTVCYAITDEGHQLLVCVHRWARRPAWPGGGAGRITPDCQAAIPPCRRPEVNGIYRV